MMTTTTTSPSGKARRKSPHSTQDTWTRGKLASLSPLKQSLRSSLVQFIASHGHIHFRRAKNRFFGGCHVSSSPLISLLWHLFWRLINSKLTKTILTTFICLPPCFFCILLLGLFCWSRCSSASEYYLPKRSRQYLGPLSFPTSSVIALENGNSELV